ncbi:MAG: hypothetical protein ABI585_00025 [Betaproteobacteria bacterium]
MPIEVMERSRSARLRAARALDPVVPRLVRARIAIRTFVRACAVAAGESIFAVASLVTVVAQVRQEKKRGPRPAGPVAEET